MLHLRKVSSSLILAAVLAACGDSQAPASRVERVVLTPAQRSIAVGQQATFTARATDGAERPVIVRFSWSSSDPTIASIDTAGVLTALRPGAVTVTATSEGRTGSAAVTVTPQVVTSVAIDPATLSLAETETRTVQVIARDADGRVVSDRAATFISRDPAVATVTPAGVVTAVSAGSTTLTATVDGVRAQAAIAVSPARVASVSITPAPLLLEIGEQVQLRATVRDTRGRDLPGLPVTWRVDNANAVITTAGLVTARQPGYLTIYASHAGVEGAAAVTVTEVSDYDYDLLYHRQRSDGNAEVFTLSFGSRHAPVRVNAGTVSRNPTPSPSGARIAFAVEMLDATGQGVSDIFAVDRDGTNSRRLTTAPGTDDQPAWSPAGGKIAYHHADPVTPASAGRSDIWVMRDDGSSPVNLTADLPASAVRRSPSWSVDGSRLAFVQVETGMSATTTSLWVMNADGTGKQRVTSTTTGFDATPTWSADGGRLMFVRHYDGDADLAIVSLGTGVVTRIPLPGQQLAPAWSPPGELIAFQQVHEGRMHLFTMRPNGRNLQLRTIDPSWGGGAAPVWIRKP